MSYPPAGSLTDCALEWEQIGAPPTTVRWIKSGIRIPLVQQPQPFRLDNRTFSEVETSFIDSEIRELLACKAIEKCDTEPIYISPLHCVAKKGGKYRLILNLRHLNSYVHAPGFRNEDIREVANFVRNDDLLISVDIKNGFYHVPVHVEDRQFLCFEWKRTYYRFTVTPFGLSVSPYYFNKVLRPVIAYLRDLGVRLCVYVDDFCLSAPKALITDHSDLLVHTLSDLGFHINYEKSILTPSARLDYIGYTIQLDNEDGFPFISAQKQRVVKIRHDIRRALACSTISARALARIAGQCISVAWCVQPAKLLLRGVYRLLSTKSSWSSQLSLDDHAREDLNWWRSAISYWNGKSICTKPITVQIETDASHLAWGAVLGHQQAGGDWTPNLSRRSSNYRELLAILLALESFLQDIKGKSIQILSDNITALAYVQHMGGPSVPLTNIARAIWTLATENGIYLNCKHIAGKDNYLADRLSRQPDKFDWQLHPSLFSYLDRVWGPHTIDRFASYLNHQLPLYNSRFADPHTTGIDALAQTDWSSHNNFVNAPFCLLPHVLDIVCQQRAIATIIAPFWRAQPFLSRLKRLSIREPLPLPSSPRLFRRQGVLPEPLRNRHWRIYAWRVRGSAD